jgi:hypothetical protein
VNPLDVWVQPPGSSSEAARESTAFEFKNNHEIILELKDIDDARENVDLTRQNSAFRSISTACEGAIFARDGTSHTDTDSFQTQTLRGIAQAQTSQPLNIYAGDSCLDLHATWPSAHRPGRENTPLLSSVDSIGNPSSIQTRTQSTESGFTLAKPTTASASSSVFICPSCTDAFVKKWKLKYLFPLPNLPVLWR